MAKNIRKVRQVDHHRNGICGAPFHAVLFRGEKNRLFVGVVFEGKGQIAVLDVMHLSDKKVGVTFGKNSFRGDVFEPELRQAVSDFEKAEGVLKFSS